MEITVYVLIEDVVKLAKIQAMPIQNNKTYGFNAYTERNKIYNVELKLSLNKILNISKSVYGNSMWLVVTAS